MPKRYWARLRADVDCQLRRGAWYPVKKLGPRQVIIDLIGEAVSMPRPSFDITSTPPRRWSVVPRPKDPVRFPGVSEYAVCPHCRGRAPLKERPASLRCTQCNALSEVAWDEPYLQEV